MVIFGLYLNNTKRAGGNDLKSTSQLTEQLTSIPINERLFLYCFIFTFAANIIKC